MSQAPQSCSEVAVDVLSYKKIFDPKLMALRVDTYQRGFVWGDDKIEQLVDDLLEYQKKADPDCFMLNLNSANTTVSAPKVSKHSKVKTPAKDDKKLSFTKAAENILSTHGKKEPMHYRVITQKALELGLLNTEGQTPEATMYAQILTEIRRHKGRGEQPRFVQHKGGFVSLSTWMGKGLAFDIEQHNKKVRAEILKRLIAMGATEFEHFVSELLAKVGFEELKVTPPSKDGGIDVRGVLVVGEVIRTKMAVQVKKWNKGNVQAPHVQQVRGSLGAHEQGLIITTSDFSKGAKEEATRPDAVPVALMNGEQLVVLMVQHEVMVARRPHDILDLSLEEDSGSRSNKNDLDLTHLSISCLSDA